MRPASRRVYRCPNPPPSPRCWPLRMIMHPMSIFGVFVCGKQTHNLPPARLPEDDTRLRHAQGLLDFEWTLPATMPLESAERLYLERQVTLARAILVSLALVDLVETAGEPARRSAVLFLSIYLLAAIFAVLAERFLPESKI